MVIALLIAGCTVVTVLTIVGLVRATSEKRARRVARGQAVPVTVLKPLCGADDSLEDNLASFFRIDYPDFELLFGVEGAEDPAVTVVQRLMKRFPRVRSRLVNHAGGRGINPKVSNLLAMLETGAHDVVVISDSNVAVGPHYLSEMVGNLLEDDVGMVTSLISGVGERALGATCENLHLNGIVAGCVAASGMFGRTLVVGKSVMFRQSVLEPLGGIGSMKNVLAEDYVMGRMVHEAGMQVRLCRHAVRNVCTSTTLGGFFRRYQRWGLMRFRMKPGAYLAEPLINPMAIALLAPLLGVAGSWPLLWALMLTLARDAISWLRLRGPEGLGRALVLAPVKDLIMLAVWITAPFVRHVTWRGHRVRVSAGTRLYAGSAPEAADDLARRLAA